MFQTFEKFAHFGRKSDEYLKHQLQVEATLPNIQILPDVEIVYGVLLCHVHKIIGFEQVYVAANHNESKYKEWNNARFEFLFKNIFHLSNRHCQAAI